MPIDGGSIRRSELTTCPAPAGKLRPYPVRYMLVSVTRMGVICSLITIAMKKYLLLLAFPALLVISLAGCSDKSTSSNAASVNAADTTHFKYMCVHACPGGFSNEPGKCPACGMDMYAVEKLKSR